MIGIELDEKELDSSGKNLFQVLSKYIRGSHIEEAIGDQIAFVVNQIKTPLFDALKSNSPERKIQVLQVAEVLVQVIHVENASVLVPVLGNVFQHALSGDNVMVLEKAAEVLGVLSRLQGLMVIRQMVDFELKRFVDWINDDYGMRRLAGILVLRALCEDAPASTFSQVPNYVNNMWRTLRDGDVMISNMARETLKRMLKLIESRGQRQTVFLYSTILQELLSGLSRDGRGHDLEIHGSLLAAVEVYGSEIPIGSQHHVLLEENFSITCSEVLKHRKTRNKRIRSAVVQLLPVLARFNRDIFAKFLPIVIDHVIGLVKKQSSLSLRVLGDITLACGGEKMEAFLPLIIAALSPLIDYRKKGVQTYPAALYCLGCLAKGVGKRTSQYLSKPLVSRMFQVGMVPPLVEASKEIVLHCGATSSLVEMWLLDAICVVLCDHKFHPQGENLRLTADEDWEKNLPFYKRVREQMEEDKESLCVLAFATLRTFPFTIMTHHLSGKLMRYLECKGSVLKIEAIKTSLLMLSRNGVVLEYAKPAADRLVKRALMVASTDRDDEVRRTCVSLLADTSEGLAFFPFMCRVENLSLIVYLINDELLEVQLMAVSLLGLLEPWNPAYVKPLLREYLIQLLKEMELALDSGNTEVLIRKTTVLTEVAKSCSREMLAPFLDHILSITKGRMDGEEEVSSSMLTLVGELALVCGTLLGSHMDYLIPSLIDMLKLQRSFSIERRVVLYRCLGHVCQGCGIVSTPLIDFPDLLTSLLSEVRAQGNKEVRNEVLKLLGILGAIDPELYKESKMESTKKERKADFEEVTFTVVNLTPDFYSKVAIRALSQILEESVSGILRKTVIEAIMTILSDFGARKSIPYLEDCIPLFLRVIHQTHQVGLQNFIIRQIGVLVKLTNLFMRRFVDDIFEELFRLWNVGPAFEHILGLLHEICDAFGDEFEQFLPAVFPRLLEELRMSNSDARQKKALAFVRHLGYNLQTFSHFVIPALADLFGKSSVRREAILAVIGALPYVDAEPYAARLVRGLLAVLPDRDNQDVVQACLKALALKLGVQFADFVPLVDEALRREGVSAPEYNRAIAKSLAGPSFDRPLTSQMILKVVGTDTTGDVEEMDEMEEQGEELNDNNAEVNKKDAVHVDSLAVVWDTSRTTTQRGWMEWIQRFSVALLVESPSPAFRACLTVAQIYPVLARQLFNIAFASCWQALPKVDGRDRLSKALLSALSSPTIPPDILQTLLDLAEYMEVEKGAQLPITHSTLGNLALQSAAYAKALRYFEEMYKENPKENLEGMINIYSQLRMQDAASGVLAQNEEEFGEGEKEKILKESWLEKLGRFDEALAIYRAREEEEVHRMKHVSMETLRGKLRCVKALGNWEELVVESREAWQSTKESKSLASIAPFAAVAAHNVGNWEEMEEYTKWISLASPDGAFYRAVISVYKKNWKEAEGFIELARQAADTELTALCAESYARAYSSVVRLQQLVELEEIVSISSTTCNTSSVGSDGPLGYNRKDCEIEEGAKLSLVERWKGRLGGMQKETDYLRRVLGVRSLLLSPLEQADSWLTFASLCNRKKSYMLTQRTICMLLGHSNIDKVDLSHPNHRVVVGQLKFLYISGKKKKAVKYMEKLVNGMADDMHGQTSQSLSKMFLRLSQWLKECREVGEDSLAKIRETCRMAVKFDRSLYKAWHMWSMTNFETIQFYKQGFDGDKIRPFLAPALQGFFQALRLAQGREGFSDVLRILTIWFRYGQHPELEQTLREGFRQVSIDLWIMVIPQLVARIHTAHPVVRKLVHDLLAQVGEVHPQALVYPLAVASKSVTPARKKAAVSIMQQMRRHSERLIEQALLVGEELIASSIVLHEKWLDGLEDAAGHFYTDDNVTAMLRRLTPLHQELQQCRFTTRHQLSFQQEFGADLQEGYALCENYKVSGDINDINDAWECFARVYHKLKKRIPKLRKLQLQHVSPSLFNCRDLDLAVPGTYTPNTPVIRISGFENLMKVYSTKQRPRKLKINGSDGNSYVFVLKAREDLRNDERVMQFFSLANSLLANSPDTKTLHIETYPVIPLAPASGLIGFVPHSDTMHQLISDYRKSTKIPLDIEFKLLFKMVFKGWDDYHKFTRMQKLHVFKYICDNTSGQELAQVMWVRAGNSERWLENRVTFTNSLAVMSMVGYILGLGDRHPNNIVIDRDTGKLIHIDFGDSFETSIHRKKFPETVPFRLTRMLVNCLDVSGVHGTFRVICERVMEALRGNRDTLMAILEAFVYDPLMHWRLASSPSHSDNERSSVRSSSALNSLNALSMSSSFNSNSPESRSVKSSFDRVYGSSDNGFHLVEDESGEDSDGKGSVNVVNKISVVSEHIVSTHNDRALQVVERIQDKLTGLDFGEEEESTPQVQVKRLIEEATSEENLCELFNGWCSFW